MVSRPFLFLSVAGSLGSVCLPSPHLFRDLFFFIGTDCLRSSRPPGDFPFCFPNSVFFFPPLSVTPVSYSCPLVRSNYLFLFDVSSLSEFAVFACSLSPSSMHRLYFPRDRIFPVFLLFSLFVPFYDKSA